MSLSLRIFLFTTTILLLTPTMHSITEFIFNNFTNQPQNQFLLYGTAKFQSSTITLTDDTPFTVGRALYFTKIPSKDNSQTTLQFSSSFIFSITPYPNRLPGHGFAFLFTPSSRISGGTSSSKRLGLFSWTNEGNLSNHVFAIEFDVFENQEFGDINNNHVGVNLNSLTSVFSSEAGFWGGEKGDVFHELKLNNGVNYQAWVDYIDMNVSVTIAKAGDKRPVKALINARENLDNVFLDEMYVGFTASTGRLVENHRILSWSFSNSNFSIGDALVTTNLPSFVVGKESFFQSKGFILGISVVGLFVVVVVVVCVLVLTLLLVSVSVRRYGILNKVRGDIEDWEVEYWPHRISFKEIEAATKRFSKENVIGVGANGNVYKGVFLGGQEVAVKRISYDNTHGMREFIAEISSLGRLRHRNIVEFIGWCKKDRGSLILVYDFMENGSLDRRLFECDQSTLLSWEERVTILKDVASGILYLHEGWDVKVLHRDIKASNVLLDKDMNARLGDFGLARMHKHGENVGTTQVVGTVGYMAPEVVQTGRASSQTDVFGFGVVILEVVSGMRPVEEGQSGLLEWLWTLMERGELIAALDERLRIKGGYSDDEVEKVINLGLLCAYPDPEKRPNMRQVLMGLEWKREVPESQDERMDANLLDITRTSEMWTEYRESFWGRRHPTFNEMQNIEVSHPMSLSGSFVILEGR